MKHLFLRLYLLLIVTFLGVGWSLDLLYDELSDNSETLTDLDMHRGTLFLLNRELARLPQDSYKNYITAIAPGFGYPLSMLSLNQTKQYFVQRHHPLGDDQYQFMLEGGQLSVFDGQNGWFLQRFEQTDHVLLLGPIQLESDSNSALFTAVFLLILALIVFIWVWPISKGLLLLTKAAAEFGAGNFATRTSVDVAPSLQPMAEQFNAMASRIQRLLRSHKELSHAVSHELRTPIARIRFALEMAQAQPDEVKRKKYFKTVDDNIEELDALVDELLTYARFDREEPKLQFADHDMLPVVTEVVESFRMTESQLNFRVVCSSQSIHAKCDETAIKRVLDNLLRNAIRYAATTISVSLSQHNDITTIAVIDDGPGIPEENWQQLFDPFVRLDQSRDRRSGGIGLGLAIVRRYMEWHGGKAVVSNVEPHGAKFELIW